jgi:hypothetical protein
MSRTTIITTLRRPGRTLTTGVAAGFAGGAAEIAWITLYAQLSGTDAAAVADGVTGSLFPALGASGAAVPLGIGLHMALAVLLGAAIAVLLRSAAPRLAGTLLEPLAVVGTLVAVWAVNFLVVLPIINPSFIELVPLGVGLTSKVLFGAAAAFVLFRRAG